MAADKPRPLLQNSLMKNLSSYYGLIDAGIRASEKDLPVGFWADFLQITRKSYDYVADTQSKKELDYQAIL